MGNHNMKHILCAAISIYAMASCHYSTLEDHAEKMAKEYTERYCPTPVINMQRTDSVTFDRTTHTFNYHYTLTNEADNAEAVSKVKQKISATLLEELKGNTSMKAFKDKDFSFRYIFRSQRTKSILFEQTFTQESYK